MRHPEHDRLAREVRSWYTSSGPEMGYRVEEGRFGLYVRNVEVSGGAPSTVLRGVTPATVPDLLDDLHARYGQHPVLLLVDDPLADATLGPALVAAGCVREAAETFLAHVGPIPSADAVPDMAIEAVDERNLADWVETKLKGFASDEAEPDVDEARRGMELRRAEMAGEGRFFLARIGGAPAATLGLYDGPDRFIFLLSTRVPFRGRGIAKSLLCTTLSDAYARGCRSVLINADPDDTPVQLYRRLGFVDEVYWRRRYRTGVAGPL